MLTYLKYGTMLIGGAGIEVVPDIISILIKMYFAASIVAVLAVIVYIVVHKSVRLYQKHLFNYLSKVKEYKNSYTNEEDLTKKSKYAKSYNKNLKNLEKEIKRILFWNTKKIYITSSLLNDDTDLSVDGKTPFTFKDELTKMVEQKKNLKTKILETLTGKQKLNHISSTAVEEVANVNETLASNQTRVSNNQTRTQNSAQNVAGQQGSASDIISSFVQKPQIQTNVENQESNRIYTDDEDALTR